MKDSILTLLSSKRVIIGVVAVIVDIALIFGTELDMEKITMLVTAVTAIASMLVGGISVSDMGKALGQPAGVDHKGREEEAVKPAGE